MKNKKKNFCVWALFAALAASALLTLAGCEDPLNETGNGNTPQDNDYAIEFSSHAVSPTRGVLDISWEPAAGASSYTVKYGQTKDEEAAVELGPALIDGENRKASLPDGAAVPFGDEVYVWVISDNGVTYRDHAAVHFTERDLANIGKDPALPLTAAYKLSRDLDLADYVDEDEDTGTGGWIPLGKYDFQFADSVTAPVSDEDKAEIFSGTLDGNDRTIRSLALSQYGTPFIGLFGAIAGAAGSPAVIKNLTIELAAAGAAPGETNNLMLDSPDRQYAGVLAGYMQDVTITNVAVKGGLKITRSNDEKSSPPQIGGLAGWAYASGSVEVKDCVSEVTMDVTADSAVDAGGLFGSLASASAGTADVTDCAYSGNITVDSESYVYAGGIAGYFQRGNTLSDAINVTRTHVQDTTINVTSISSEVGGLFGYTNGNLSYCSFNGSIDVTDTATTGASNYVGGIVGTTGTTVSSKIEKCWTKGDGIKINAGKNTYAGGIAGLAAVENCFTTFKNIEAESSGIACIGGINGSVSGGFTINKCYSNCESIIANTSGDSYARVGGITGTCASNKDTQITNNFVYSGTIISVIQTGSHTKQANRISGSGNADLLPQSNYSASTVTVKKGSSLDNAVEETITVGGLNGSTRETDADADFYTTTLGWSSDVWDFTSLPPVLKPAN